MKVAGRKTSGAYELYGFIPKVENGKHSAICMTCNRVLQNTASVRLQKHRNSCVATRSFNSDPAHFPNIQVKRRIPTKAVLIQQHESINSNVKTEHTEENNMVFDDATFHGNTVYDDTLEKLQDYSPLDKCSPKKDKTDDKLKAKIQYLKEKSKYLVNEMNNLKFEKTLMVLKVKKLKLEVQQLELYS